jgi:hypothetical protein
MMGTLAVTLAFGLVLFGCEDDSGDTENTDPKKITITGITREITGNVTIVLTSELSKSDEVIIAEGQETIHSGSVTVSLKNLDDTSDWTGSGSYYLGLGTGGNDNPVPYIYTNGANFDMANLPKINISETTTTVYFNKFKKVPEDAFGGN